MRLSILLLAILFFFSIKSVYAGELLVAGNSAYLKKTTVTHNDYRTTVLKNYLESKNSPLALYTDELIFEADRNGLDWRLIPAITGVESGFGKRIPPNSHNAYGWAGGKYKFDSWEQSISIVANTLRVKYIDKNALTVHQIGRIYAPPSQTWAYNVGYFIKQIDESPLNFSL
ncbi:glucosaminidase domain-containing protein [Candidatus Woesebacteria bacterium]|nr:MAG: glucosaminidase domain-containing protein [Candidatus Woesebacteria bacterium]